MAEPKTKAIARRMPVPILEIRTLGDVMDLAERLAKSEMVPKEYRSKPENILVAMQLGAEVGLKPMQALQSIAVINGRPSLWGDAGLGIVMAHPAFESIEEKDDPASQIATCTITRRGLSPVTRTFSQADADGISVAERDANGNVKWVQLSSRAVWRSYKKRMRQMRARWWAMKDSFPDALKGLEGREWVESDLVGTVAEDAVTGRALGSIGKPDDMMPKRKGELPAPPATPGTATGVGGSGAGDSGGSIPAGGSGDKASEEVSVLPSTTPTPAPIGGADPWQELRGLIEGENSPAEAIPAPPPPYVRATDAEVRTGFAEPTAPLTLAPGALTFELNGKPVVTAGITKETILKAFKQAALADEMTEKGTAKNLLGAAFGVEHRNELTEPQGRAYVAALTKIVNAGLEKRRGK